MRKSQWVELSSESAGEAYGHVPGHQFHDLDCVISRRGDKYRVEIVEKWGSCQGYDEVHGTRRVVAIDTDLDAAVRIANSRAQQAEMREAYMIQALSSAHAAAVDAIEAD